MKNLREQYWLNNSFFGMCEEALEDGEFGLYFWFGGFISVIFGTIFFGFPFDMLFFSAGVAISLGVALAVTLYFALTNVSRLYKGRGMPSCYGSYDFPARVREYFTLSKADRALYPTDILSVLRDPDLSNTQRYALDRQMRGIYLGIQERDKAKRVLAKREVDVDHILEYMKQSQESVAIETNTFKEYA